MTRTIEISQYSNSDRERLFFAHPNIWGKIAIEGDPNRGSTGPNVSVVFTHPEYSNYAAGINLVAPQTYSQEPLSDDIWTRRTIAEAVGRFNRNAASGEF
jgi:hypothetical protein